MLHLVSIQVFFSMKNIILVNIPWKCENAKGIGQFHFSSNLSRSNLRAVGNRHLYKLRLHLCGHCEIARSFFRDWWTKRKKKKREKNPDYFWFHPLFLIYVLRIEGKPEFHFHDSIPQPMLHVDEILTLLFFSRKRSFNTPVEFSISVPQEQ